MPIITISVFGAIGQCTLASSAEAFYFGKGVSLPIMIDLDFSCDRCATCPFAEGYSYRGFIIFLGYLFEAVCVNVSSFQVFLPPLFPISMFAFVWRERTSKTIILEYVWQIYYNRCILRHNYRVTKCISCGQPCDKRSVSRLCKLCYGKSIRKAPDDVVEKRRKKQKEYDAIRGKRNICIDCGKRIDRRSRRCKDCHSKYFGSLTSGKNHWNWKGGRRLQGDYYVIYAPDHPHANKRFRVIYEHVLIWEQTHHRLLPEGWVVHHLNGIKTDNRPINLVGLPNRKHSQVLTAKARRIQELEALIETGNHLLL